MIKTFKRSFIQLVERRRKRNWQVWAKQNYAGDQNRSMSQKLREKRVAGGEKRADPYCKHCSHIEEVIL